VPLIVYKSPEDEPLIPLGKAPPVMEIVAELVVVYTIGVIAIFRFTRWVGLPLVPTWVMVGTGFTVAVTAKRVVDTQPAVLFLDCA
jgi:hypothetical protein